MATQRISDLWSHTGVGVLNDGRLVFGSAGGHSLEILDVASQTRTLVATPTHETHGLLVVSSGFQESVWIADPGAADGEGAVIRVGLDGRLQERLEDPLDGVAGRFWRPTSVAVIESGEHRGDIWVADGYGRSLVHVFRADGTILSITGNSTGLSFECPHGLTVDTRGPVPTIAIADRGNRRIVFMSTAGDIIRTVSSPAMTSPSSIAVRGADLIVTDLFGSLLAVNEADDVRTLVGGTDLHHLEGWPNRIESGRVAGPQWIDRVLNSPHGVAVGASGEIYLTEWCLGGRLSKLDFLDLRCS